MNILQSADNDDSWIDILVADKWEETTELYNEYLASCWLAHIGYIALEQLKPSKVLLIDFASNRLDQQRNARRFSNLIRRGCREHHAGAFVYRLFLDAEVPQSKRNDEILSHVKEICKKSQTMKEVLSAETKTRDSAYYKEPFLPLFVSSLRQFGDLDEVGVWKPLYKAAYFLLHERVKLQDGGYVVTSNNADNNADADQEAQEVYTWAHSLRTIAECGVNFYEVKNIIGLDEELKNTNNKLEDTEKCLSETKDKLEDTEKCLSETKDKLEDTEKCLSETKDKLEDTEKHLSETKDKPWKLRSS